MNQSGHAELTGVSETCLWTLWNRSLEAARADSDFVDPWAVELVNRIDYPYRERFGLPQQIFAMRATAYDSVVRRYHEKHPNGVVIALAEGLQTSYWRLGRPQLRWMAVDLPAVVALRESLLPHEDCVTNVTGSAFDLSWMDAVPAGAPPLITAEGLFMYFDKATVTELIRDCSTRFPGGHLVFDAVPSWWSRRKNKTVGAKRDSSSNSRYVVPDMHSGISAHDAAQLPTKIAGITGAREVMLPAGRGVAGAAQRTFYHGKFVPSRWRASLYELTFASDPHLRC